MPDDMIEDQYSVTAWAQETFGKTTAARAITRVNQELAELLVLASTDGDKPKMQSECADILITLYRVASVLGFDLHSAVDDKMEINRARKWKLDGSGCGQHIPEDSNAV